MKTLCIVMDFMVGGSVEDFVHILILHSNYLKLNPTTMTNANRSVAGSDKSEGKNKLMPKNSKLKIGATQHG